VQTDAGRRFFARRDLPKNLIGVQARVVPIGQMIESPKLVEFDLMNIDRDEQTLRYLSLFAVVGKHSALMWHHKSVCDSVVGGVVESRSIAKNIYGIFVPSQQSVRTEIRNLIPRVAGDGIGKGDL
jgi:hypothetical protein